MIDVEPRAPDERVIRDFKPAGRSVVVTAARALVMSVLVMVAGAVLVARAWAPGVGSWMVGAGIVCGLVALSLAGIARDARRYVLTNKRLSSTWGVIRRFSIEHRLDRVQSVEVHGSFLQRVLGLGSIRVTSASQLGLSVVFMNVLGSEQVATDIRRAVDDVREMPARKIHARELAVKSEASRRPRPMVLGVCGGIGSGKSTLGAEFAKLGWLVIDSDARAKAALDREDVRKQLVEWWGEGVLDAHGRIDRAKVAAIVFGDPAQREKLEGLVHPIVRQDRARMIDEAAQAGAIGVIVDAPLLFEAGVDKECDGVIFVDTPLEIRVKRVRETRRWDEAELARREQAQLPLDEKRRRSRYVLTNGGDASEFASQVKALAERLARSETEARRYG